MVGSFVIVDFDVSGRKLFEGRSVIAAEQIRSVFKEGAVPAQPPSLVFYQLSAIEPHADQLQL